MSLRGSSDVGRVRRSGVARRVDGLTVIVAPGPAGPARIAFVAGRAVGSAVDRNRAKRRLREAAARVHLRAGHDYVVVASPRVIEMSFDELVGGMRRAMEGR